MGAYSCSEYLFKKGKTKEYYREYTDNYAFPTLKGKDEYIEINVNDDIVSFPWEEAQKITEKNNWYDVLCIVRDSKYDKYEKHDFKKMPHIHCSLREMVDFLNKYAFIKNNSITPVSVN